MKKHLNAEVTFQLSFSFGVALIADARAGCFKAFSPPHSRLHFPRGNARLESQ